ncbi:phosphatase PAP2 family protein [Acinetobacter sp. S40]|uniref:phosphatase PAP2 family protein n=1 Tax=unclassified Acinetobacter TaxID=196816 RepID=UPI00190BA819|nr:MULTISPECIES: phosphatase PAP2 family protein [unclassified Acinetobacter]MBJ9986038.1 phosphatase PAP2 family protein [Acinetobacter sp. S40]MBK0064011.1 phosphatase PAP2 family protein [Acinetobacter sp. S55]MBK0067296.1 phosphatase PAP2 family protein [Acinetobacter sp. S54]
MPYLILCIGCILFLLSVFGLYSPFISGFDLHAVQTLSEHRNKVLDQVIIVLAYLGGMPFVLFFTSVWCLCCAWYKKYSTLIFILMGISGSIALGWLLKWCFNRPRPPEIYHLVQNYGASFPSAHSVYAATFASLIMLISQNHFQKVYFMGASCLWLLFMGLSRIYAGVHYPTDVLAGWSIGFIWISLLWLWLQSRLDNNKLFVR